MRKVTEIVEHQLEAINVKTVREKMGMSQQKFCVTLGISIGTLLAILNHNVSTAYLIPAETYEWLMDRLEDAESAEIVQSRVAEKEQAIAVDLDDL